MSFLVDTCVLSELIRPQPTEAVLAWLEAQPQKRLHLSVVSLGEFVKGIEAHPDEKRRLKLETWLRESFVLISARTYCPSMLRLPKPGDD